MTNPGLIERRIRSFVRREGRLTAAQQRALTRLWGRYGVDPPTGQLDLERAFGRAAERVLEIGFGDGEALALTAQARPALDFLGIETHRPGVGHLLLTLERLALTNVRVLCMDAVEALERHLPPASLDRIQIFFPDPWPKLRHHKRRLIQPAVVGLLADAIKPGGLLHLATDWEDYAGQMLAVVEADDRFGNLTGAGRFAPRPADRPITKFERRGRRLGHPVYDLLFRRR